MRIGTVATLTPMKSLVEPRQVESEDLTPTQLDDYRATLVISETALFAETGSAISELTVAVLVIVPAGS